LVQQLRALCDRAISSSWHAGNKEAAQAASDLLDEANMLLADADGQLGSGSPDSQSPQPKQELDAAAATAAARSGPCLPDETFFLSADRVRECLTLNIDSSILMASQPERRRGGWPLGKRRSRDGTGGAAPGA